MAKMTEYGMARAHFRGSMLRARLRDVLPPEKPEWKPSVRGCATTLRRLYRHAVEHGWWPCAADLARRGTSARARAWIVRDLHVLEAAGLVTHAGVASFIWRLTQLGCDALNVPMPSAPRPWRADERKLAKLRRRLTEAILEHTPTTYEG